MKKSSIVSLAVGSAVATLALTPVAGAADNPFSATPLAAGYQLAQADKKAEGKCGEAKCGAAKPAAEKQPEAKCGEAKCGADKKATDKKSEGSCGSAKKADASCGAKK